MNNLLVVFIIISITNVILQTCCHIVTVKCNRTIAALANAVAYGFYTYVIIFTTIEGLPMWGKAIVVAVANFIGVFVVKTLEKHLEKERMWKLEMALPYASCDPVLSSKILEGHGIPNNYRECGGWYIFDCYCMKKENTKFIVDYTKQHDGKCSAYKTEMEY